jgi:hypothetical protein
MDPNLPGIFITDPNIPAQEADHGETGAAPEAPSAVLLRPVGTCYTNLGRCASASIVSLWIIFRDPSFVTMNPKFICIFRYHQSYNSGSIT